MALKISFLAVGNADCMIAVPESKKAVVVDIGDAKRAETALAALEISAIAVIYVTHEHRDHVPTILGLHAFLEGWRRRGGTIGLARLPTHQAAAWGQHYKKLESQGDHPGAKRMRGALLWLLDAHRTGILPIRGPGTGESPHRDGDMCVQVLHPSYMFEAQVDPAPSANERSMVIQLSYGQFRAMLLADIDGQGLEACLQIGEKDLRAQVVKIPHHGAWPQSTKGAQDVAALLSMIRPELAVLSVGSKNPHGHVAPELFSCLIELKARTGLRFTCTEVTRTCMLPASERASLGRSGLSERHLCAGDITVTADASGGFHASTAEMDHPARVSGIPYAACAGRASLTPPAGPSD